MQPHSQKTKVSGTARIQKTMLVLVGMAVIFLGLMIRVASQKPIVPTPTPTLALQITTTITPTITPFATPAPLDVSALPSQRFYIQRYAPSSQLIAYDNLATERFRIEIEDVWRGDGTPTFSLNRDGTLLIIRRGNGISAIDTTTGNERWYAPSIYPEGTFGYRFITPDQQRIVVGSWDYNTSSQNVTMLDLATGAETTQIQQIPITGLPFGADHQQRLWFRSQSNMTVIGINQPFSQTLELDIDIGVSALTPDGTQVWIFSNDGTRTIIDTATLQTTTSQISDTDLDLSSIYPAPNGGAFLIGGSEVTNETISNARLSYYAEPIWYVADQNQFVPIKQRAGYNGAAWSADGQQIYLASYDQMDVVDRRTLAIQPIHTTQFNNNAIGFLTAPSVAWNPQQQPTLTPITAPISSNPPPITPFASITQPPITPFASITQPDERDVAWLWERELGTITAYQRNGQQRIITKNAMRVIARDGEPPLILNNNIREGTWSVFDPVTQGETVFASKPPSDRFTATTNDDFVLSPDGKQLAMIVNSDLISSDALTNTPQLLIADLNTGEVEAVADRLSTPSLEYGEPIVWRDNTIYYRQDRFQLTEQRILRLHAFNLDTKTSQEIRTYEISPLFLGHVPDSDWIVTESYTDTHHAQLRLFNLATSEDQLIYSGIFVNYNEVWIAPNGQYIAYLNNISRRKATLHIYNVTTGHQQEKIRLNTFDVPTFMYWLPDSSAILWRNYAENQLISATTDTITSQPSTGFLDYNNPNNFVVKPDREQVVLNFDFQDQRSTLVLQVYPHNSDQPSISLPVETNANPQTLSIVYVGK